MFFFQQPLELGSISNILPFSFFILIKFLPETLKNTIVFCDTLSSLLCFLLLDCKASDWPILYLGLPLGGNPIACGFWDPVIERISRRLDGWQKAYLSFGDRIALIHSCLSYILSYFLSLFKIPASVVAKIERLQRDFLWLGVGEGHSKHLWDTFKWLGCQHFSQMVTSLSLEGYCTSLFKIFSSILGLWWEMGKEFAFGKICGGGTNL
ncbi:hypothetical protein CK203_081999 [Vitis vinifera]|uniref:Uncharacterized protein n=1 Tax=Vitis vinifera TaxID=29760 RepID=A0A438BW98_VITVI|nr:hypothetical protein CK203_081999 [Vitis vinifera]